MKTRNVNLIVATTLVFAMVSSCETEPDIKEEYLHPEDAIGMTKLGKKLENPYSVENMRRAYLNIRSSKVNGRTFDEEVDIATTHRYLKFMPKNEEELAILKLDTVLAFYEYPLDHEITEEGTYYHDPTIPIGTPTYQYASIPVDKEIPDGVEYELLTELFIPDEYKDEAEGNRVASDEFIDALVEESLRLRVILVLRKKRDL